MSYKVVCDGCGLSYDVPVSASGTPIMPTCWTSITVVRRFRQEGHPVKQQIIHSCEASECRKNTTVKPVFRNQDEPPAPIAVTSQSPEPPREK